MSAIAIKQIALSLDKLSEAYVPDGGIVRYVAIAGEMERVASINGKRRIIERVVLFVDHDPESGRPDRLRNFLTLDPGEAFALKPETKATFCGVALSYNTGRVAYVYELEEQDVTRSRLESPLLLT